MATPKEKAYCHKCEERRTFIHKSVLVGYECGKCGTPYKHSNTESPEVSNERSRPSTKGYRGTK